MIIRLRFYGVFKSAVNAGELDLQVDGETPTVRAVVHELVAQSQFRDLKRLLVDDKSRDPRPNALIMVSGKEIGTLNELETILTERDEVAFLPIAHGG